MVRGIHWCSYGGTTVVAVWVVVVECWIIVELVDSTGVGGLVVVGSE